MEQGDGPLPVGNVSVRRLPALSGYCYYRQQSTDTVRLLDTYLLEGMYLRWKEANDEAITVFDKGIALAISRKDTTNMLVLQRKKLEVLYKQSRF